MIKFREVEGGNVFFTSDTHAFHKNIARGTSQWKDGYRDFNNEIEMTEHLADNINRMVGKNDILIHCGDWSFGGRQNINKFANMLNCKDIILIIGNHDHHIYNNEECPWGASYTDHVAYLNINGQDFYISHYPNVVWHQSHKGCIHLHGHTHGSFIHPGKALDVGVDRAFQLFGEYRPFTFDEVMEYCNKRDILLESHHNPFTN